VLFSNADVVAIIQRNFEPVWVSVRPVPLVRIDFGNQVVTRTLNGNIATSVCDAEGRVLDTLPGIYTAEVYRDRLDQLRLLANYVSQVQGTAQEQRLRDYHRGQAAALKDKKLPARFVNVAPISKRRIEAGVKAALVQAAHAPAMVPQGRAAEPAALPSVEDVAHWKELVQDTEVNESVRRQQIHELLAETGPVRPEQITRRLYREVLHADLDDPYLGLGNLLFANYPFAKEDKGR
jgi:hypothetical protein